MTTIDDDNNRVPSFRFKRRKITHIKRARTDEDTPPELDTAGHDAATPSDAPAAAQDEEDSVPNLKEIIRNRKRPRDRVKDVASKSEAVQTEHVQAEAPRADQYTSRFIAQTGQVVDSSDTQM